jgi:hypothetical protein
MGYRRGVSRFLELLRRVLDERAYIDHQLVTNNDCMKRHTL